MNTSYATLGVLAVAVALATTSCTDGLAPQRESDDAGSPTPMNSGEVLGGEAALAALGRMIQWLESEGRLDEVPEAAHAIFAEFGGGFGSARAELVPNAQPSLELMEDGVSGPYSFNGVTYYEKGGELYAPLGTNARIAKAYTTGVLYPGYGEVNAGFTYAANRGTQTMSWSVTNPRTGQGIRSGVLSPFGSSKGSYFAAEKTFSGHLKIYDLPQCDIGLDAGSTHSAWIIGGWTLGDITFNTGGQWGIKIVPSTSSSAFATTSLNPLKQILCPEPDPDNCDNAELDRTLGSVRDGAMLSLAPTGPARLSCDGDDGDGGGFADDYGCTICQQWFTVYRGKIIGEWWECYEGQGNECLAS